MNSRKIETVLQYLSEQNYAGKRKAKRRKNWTDFTCNTVVNYFN
jgi:hypothetical protein